MEFIFLLLLPFLPFLSHHTDTNIRHTFDLKIADRDLTPAEDCSQVRWWW